MLFFPLCRFENYSLQDIRFQILQSKLLSVTTQISCGEHYHRYLLTYELSSFTYDSIASNKR